jgi:MerR family mercuric resistance operon transcriptional regulator
MAESARTIGQLAKAAGVGVETVRFYERRGLLKRPARPDSGYRRYGEEALVRLRYIRLGQGLGLSLADIEDLFNKLEEEASFCAAVRAAVGARLLRLNAEVAALEHLRGELADFLDKCGARPKDMPCPTRQALLRFEMSPAAKGARA